MRPHESYLRDRWAAGCDNASLLWRELRARGYTGAASTVRQFLARWRAAPGRLGKKGPPPPRSEATGEPPPARARRAAPTPVQVYSPHQAAWLLLKDQDGCDTLSDHERAYVVALRETCPAVARLQELASAFRALVRTHDRAALATWLAQAEQSEMPEVCGFASGLRADRAAVEAGITLPWSQGQTEGQVNRLKCVSSDGPTGLRRSNEGWLSNSSLLDGNPLGGQPAAAAVDGEKHAPAEQQQQEQQ